MQNNLSLLLLLSLALFVGGEAFAQRSSGGSEATGVVKLNVLSLFTRTGSLSYEHVLSDKLSLQLGVQYTLPRRARILGVNLLGEDGRMNRFSVTPELRYYPAGAAPTGFYVGPFARYVNLSVSGDVTQDINGQTRTVSGRVTQNTYSFGGVLGGQWVFGEHFSLDVFGGPYFSFGSINVSQNITEEDYNFPSSVSFPVWLRAGLSLGYSF
jgi:hypothetical protein